MTTANYLKTALLLGALTGVLLLCGYLIGGQSGVVIAFVVATAMNFGSYWFSDRVVLRMHRAQPVSEAEAPRLHAMVDGLVARAGMPKPKLYLLPQPAPNAFATGRDPEHGAVAVTQGLLQLMNDEEVEGVIAHELAHIKNRDILISTVAATIAGAISMIAFFARYAAMFGGARDDRGGGGSVIGMLAAAIVAPIAAMIIQLAVSRSREYAADATGAGIAGQPYGLARALEKLDGYSKRIPLPTSPAMNHLFIVMPLGGGFGGLFSTHPPIAERIRRLVGSSR